MNCSLWILAISTKFKFASPLFFWQESKLKAARMNIYVRRGGPNYQTGLARMRALGEELGIPLEV